MEDYSIFSCFHTVQRSFGINNSGVFPVLIQEVAVLSGICNCFFFLGDAVHIVVWMREQYLSNTLYSGESISFEHNIAHWRDKTQNERLFLKNIYLLKLFIIQLSSSSFISNKSPQLVVCCCSGKWGMFWKLRAHESYWWVSCFEGRGRSRVRARRGGVSCSPRGHHAARALLNCSVVSRRRWETETRRVPLANYNFSRILTRKIPGACAATCP